MKHVKIMPLDGDDNQETKDSVSKGKAEKDLYGKSKGIFVFYFKPR